MEMRGRVINRLIYPQILKTENETYVELSIYVLQLEEVGFILKNFLFYLEVKYSKNVFSYVLIISISKLL
jgi:hypothetical protein